MSALLLDSVLKGTAVLVLAHVVSAVFARRSSAADRHLLWTIAVVALLAVPALSAALPSVRWPAVPVPWTALAGAGSPAAPAHETAMPGPAVEEGAVSSAPVHDRSRDETSGSPAVSPPTPSGSGAVVPAAPVGGGASLSPLVLIWGLGASAVLLYLAAQAALFARERRAARPFGPGRVERIAGRLSRSLGLERSPTVFAGPRGAMPYTWGVFRSRLLLPAGAADWTDARLEAVLAHELAHVRRRDCLAQLTAAVACVLYWFHPLAWQAAHRLEREREHACDDEVLALGASASGYAGCLVDLARDARGRRISAAVVTAMARPNGLRRRVDSILAPDRCRRGLSRRRAGLFGAVGLAVAFGVATLQPLAATAVRAGGSVADPTPAEVRETPPSSPSEGSGAGASLAGRGHASAPRPGRELPAPMRSAQESDPCWAPDVSHSMNVHHGDDEHRLRWEGPGCESEILVRGEPSFDEDFDWITGLSGDGLVRVEERSAGVRRRVEIRPAPDGVTIEFRLDGRELPIDAEARAWIETRVVTILRQTGIAAADRTAWILSREGAEGVFAEVERMSADRSQALYLGALLAAADLDDTELRRLLETAADRVGSDGRLSSLLEDVALHEPERVVGSHRDGFLEAADRVGSDGDLTRLALALVEMAPEDDEAILLALEAAYSGVGSDGDMSDLLVRVAALAPDRVTGSVREAYLEATGTVGSDGDLRRALGRLVRGADGDPEVVALALDASMTIGSDGDMADFLVELAGVAGPSLDDADLRRRYLRALDTVGSDGDERRVRDALERIAGRP